MKTAVIYYSNSGTTKRIAERIAERFSADVTAVEPAKAYGGYLSAVARVGREKLTKKGAGLRTRPGDFSGYDLIFVGFPVWYGTMPSFLQKYLQESTIGDAAVVPFVTAGANGEKSSLEAVQRFCANTDADHYLFKTGKRGPEVEQWLEEVAAAYTRA